MRKPKHSFESKGNFIAGNFSFPEDPSGEIPVISPANTKDELGSLKYSYHEVDRAVDSARQAFRTWRKTRLEDRIRFLKKYQEALTKNQDAIIETMAREVGKPLWECATEVKAMIGKINITIESSLPLVKDQRFEGMVPGGDGAMRFKPLGVLSVIGPFNFPGHLPNGHIVPALLTGNTVVFKPSEKTPFTGQWMAECFAEAGLPKGVFSLIQGERETSRRLCSHEGVDGVLFTGSYEVGAKIKKDTLDHYWKLIALEMGGKNAAIVWEDADLAVALRETLTGAYITTGQRCSCTSRIFIHEKLVDEFVSKFHERAKAFKIAHPFENPFMGSLIDGASVDRFMKFHGIAAREGAELVMRGKELELEDPGHYVTPTVARFPAMSLEEVKKSVFLQTEIFAPSVGIVPIKEIEEAVEFTNSTQYGLVSSIFTKSKETFEKCWEDLDAGLINWNKTTVGAASKLPFGGVKKSGNHYPTALTAPYYCTYPVATLEISKPDPAPPTEKAMPGLNWG